MDILDYWLKWFPLFLILKSLWYFLPSFESNSLSVKEKLFKTDFQDDGHGGDRNEFSYFSSKVIPILPIKFQVSWPFGSGEVQNRFAGWRPWRPSWVSDRYHDGGGSGHLGFLIYKSPKFFLSSFEWIGLSVREKKFKIDFQRPSWISDRNDFSYFWSTGYPDSSYKVSSLLAFRFKKRSK